MGLFSEKEAGESGLMKICGWADKWISNTGWLIWVKATQVGSLPGKATRLQMADCKHSSEEYWSLEMPADRNSKLSSGL